ncbi:abhydrolase domain-containing protein 16A-like protein [Dinothrombium tinctorium]|uniref:Abhydrolase domain-containing protein 16A-like protein n=1 Tax=Dinothrombium tinctorium TaxID=1965070 RepID=A0A443RQ54_9ACAR|nr:abhydrolase domain-containing protein 16A-like protein [Dinothrombium tinctorium]
MKNVIAFLNCLLGPRLYRIYRAENHEGRYYKPTAVEFWSDNIIKIMNFTYSLTVYTSPILLTLLYRRGNLNLSASNESYYLMVRVFGTATVVLISALCLRGCGRFANSDYRSFIYEYLKLRSLSIEHLNAPSSPLSRYEFDFDRWPIAYNARSSQLSLDRKELPKPLTSPQTSAGLINLILRMPLKLISAVAVHTFGRRMIYPGSVALLQKALDPVLREGRTRLIETYGGRRYKLLTLDGNSIDALFVDRRGNNTATGKTLVIGCEGNAGFYEIGTLGTPLEAGYSVLGWNHPGFGGSTGIPFPSQEVNAIDTVVNFAVEKLGFKMNQILIFAWSIGGYPATWAAMTYPEIKGLILDASFDDILPLAIAKMPTSWKPLVSNTIKTYFDLNNSRHLKYYSGPVLFIRRLKDEIINTNESEPLRTNRANDLLIKLFSDRFPHLVEDENALSVLFEWLSSEQVDQRRLLSQYLITEEYFLNALKSCVEKDGSSYPLSIGGEADTEEKIKLLLYLANKHLIDYDSTHCTPLPKHLFIEPWDLFKALNISNESKL